MEGRTVTVRMIAGDVRATHAANSSALESDGCGRRAIRMRTGDSLVTMVLRFRTLGFSVLCVDSPRNWYRRLVCRRGR